MPTHPITVRPITEEDLPHWWERRLQALRDHPEAFGADYQRARQTGYHYLIERNFGNDHPANVILAAFDSTRQILSSASTYGSTGKRAHIATIWGVYTVPQARGQGLSTRLDAAIDHFRSFPELRQVHISVNGTNLTALHLYEAAGFVRWGRRPRAIALPDRFDDEIHLALMLDDGAYARRP